ncbi:hypothetical protein HQR03_03155 [Psychrobacter okhotskensis]|uniref:hypothetical protein n=1 Tax=Psychrobacter okhotskensis TaxID=212403 RepID=UPI0015636B45|nr:hypothetical protein [Psychrobacter okhotskensis]NRD69534.1 hypothetical protein [Psychrobacter okhotskensis]
MRSDLLLIGGVTLLATATATATTKMSSDYTSLKEEDCRTLNTDQDIYQADCPSKHNYLLQAVGRDLRLGVNLIYNHHKVSYQPLPSFRVGETVEWRYEKVGNLKKYHALIYRIYTAQIDPLDGDAFYLSREQDKQQLVVIRLNKEKSCLLGVIEPSKNMNREARKLADNKLAECIK